LAYQDAKQQQGKAVYRMISYGWELNPKPYRIDGCSVRTYLRRQ
jgi:hypothetical protein